MWNLTTAGDVKSLGRVQLGGYGVVKKSGITINDYGTSSTCSTSEEGQERYNSSTKAIEYCNGTDWKAPSSGSASSGGKILDSELQSIFANSMTTMVTSPLANSPKYYLGSGPFFGCVQFKIDKDMNLYKRQTYYSGDGACTGKTVTWQNWEFVGVFKLGSIDVGTLLACSPTSDVYIAHYEITSTGLNLLYPNCYTAPPTAYRFAWGS